MNYEIDYEALREARPLLSPTSIALEKIERLMRNACNHGGEPEMGCVGCKLHYRATNAEDAVRSTALCWTGLRRANDDEMS